MQLGVTPWRMSVDATGLCEQAELAEQWGYDAFFLPESHFTGAMPIPDPLLLLAAVAARTNRIRLATSSWLLPIRQPLLAAEQVAALDQLSGGRLTLGLGRGFQPGMLEAFGVASKDKRTVFSATLQGMLEAWSDDKLVPGCIQQPHPPLLVAAFGPKALAQAGRLGLPYLASPMESMDELVENHDRHREAVDEAGHSAVEDIAIMRTVFICEDDKRCGKVRTALVENGARDSSLVGSASQVAEGIELYREQLGMNQLVAVRPRIRGIAEPENRASMEKLVSLRP